jgi:hypothetical protein
MELLPPAAPVGEDKRLRPEGLLLPSNELVLLTPAAEAERKDLREAKEAREALADAERQWAEYKAYSDGGKPRTDIKHGICKGPRCGRRTQLWLPASLCTKCLKKAAAAAGIDIDQPPTAGEEA